MKFRAFFSSTISVILVVLANQVLLAQHSSEDFIMPRTNSKAVINQTIASTQIEITYNRPNLRGREIFGNLVPYNKIWRTGSDEATELFFSTPVSLEGISINSCQMQGSSHVHDIILFEGEGVCFGHNSLGLSPTTVCSPWKEQFEHSGLFAKAIKPLVYIRFAVFALTLG